MVKSKMLCLTSLAAAALLALPAQAMVTAFVTNLSSAGETPSTSTATGMALVSFDDVAQSIGVALIFQGLANGSPFGHIHCCTASAGAGNAGVALQFATLPQSSYGSYNDTFTPVNFTTILSGALAGQAYVNIHTPGTYGGGEIRGFLRAVAVPEPGSLALFGAGLALLGWVGRRRAL